MSERTLEWADWGVADKTHPYPRQDSELVNEDVLIALIRLSGRRICGYHHQHAPGCAPVVDGVGIALSMRGWGDIMYRIEDPSDTKPMGYCRWAWDNPKCEICCKEKP